MRSFLNHLLLSESLGELQRISGIRGVVAFWLHPKTKKCIMTNVIRGSGGPWHATTVCREPRRFGVTEQMIKDSMKQHDAERYYFSDFEQDENTFYKAVVDQKNDQSDGVVSLLSSRGWLQCYFDFPEKRVDLKGKHGFIKREDFRNGVEVCLFNMANVESFRIVGMNNEWGFDEFPAADAELFIKSGRIPQRTEVGRTMAQFREEISEKSEHRHHYILDTQRKTIAFGPLAEKSAKEILETRFKGNRNFVIMDSNVLHKVGDVIRI
jgi:hypothetical protein